jgi:4-carboxymuconolactone decarboxylase
MQILRASEGETAERTGAPIFLGQVHGRSLPESEHLNAAIVSFAAGARTKLHRHTSDQLLYIVSGIGKVGDIDGEHVVSVGDSILIPANTDHWHGAGDTGSPMAHLTVQRKGSETTVAE